MRTMAAGEFKAKCLAVMNEVAATGEPVLVTKRGKPVARVLAAVEQTREENPESISRFVRGMGAIPGNTASLVFTNEEWGQMEDEKWAEYGRGSLC